MAYSKRQFAFLRLAAGGVLGALLVPLAALAQAGGEQASREVVQPLPPAETADLTEALRRIAVNPQDVDALLMAGKASLRLDPDAAMGFFARARDLGTATGNAKAGLAAALVYKKKPVEALQLFAEAEAEGGVLAPYAGDYGLALDLVGDNARAQTYYRMALQDRSDTEVTRRLALSQAIGGDQAGSEMTLLPLLQRQDLAAYRMRAFALATLGRTEEAVAVAEAIMPASLAARISPYLRYMPRLTRAQQAAAANFGHFPEASAIGRDDPRIAEYARATAVGTRMVSSPADGRLVPAGEPLGRAEQPAPAPPEPRIAVVREAPQPIVQNLPAMVVPDGFSLPEPAPRVSEAPAVAVTFQPEPPLEPAQNAELPRPSFSVALAEPEAAAADQGVAFDLAALADNRSGTISPEDVAPQVQEPPAEVVGNPAPAPQPPPPPLNLADAFADLTTPTTRAGPVSGAVDVTAIEPVREAKPEPPKPAHPSRIWVQVATGRDRRALAADWRRIVSDGGAAMRGRGGYIARWGQTNRLVTGPFDSRQQALAFVNTLKQAGLDTFMFTSEAGEAVDPLPRR